MVNKVLVGLVALLLILGLAYVAGLAWMQATANLALANAVQMSAASALLDRLIVGLVLLMMLGMAVGITLFVVWVRGKRRVEPGLARRVAGPYATREVAFSRRAHRTHLPVQQLPVMMIPGQYPMMQSQMPKMPVYPVYVEQMPVESIENQDDKDQDDGFGDFGFGGF